MRPPPSARASPGSKLAGFRTSRQSLQLTTLDQPVCPSVVCTPYNIESKSQSQLLPPPAQSRSWSPCEMARFQRSSRLLHASLHFTPELVHPLFQFCLGTGSSGNLFRGGTRGLRNGGGRHRSNRNGCTGFRAAAAGSGATRSFSFAAFSFTASSFAPATALASSCASSCASFRVPGCGPDAAESAQTQRSPQPLPRHEPRAERLDKNRVHSNAHGSGIHYADDITNRDRPTVLGFLEMPRRQHAVHNLVENFPLETSFPKADAKADDASDSCAPVNVLSRS